MIMWALTVDAGSLLSVVKMDAKKYPDVAKRHGAMDEDIVYLVIRARIRGSLEYVCDVLDALAGDAAGYERPVIDDDKRADYRFRTIVTAEEWKKFLCYEVDGITYTGHVKEETVQRQPKPQVPGLYQALLATWNAWAGLQPTAPYSGLPVYSYSSGAAKNWGAGTWKPKPDCKNCQHAEISHTVKGDKCNKQIQGGVCACRKYEPVPVSAKPAIAPSVDCAVQGCGHKRRSHAVNDTRRCTINGCACAGWKEPGVMASPFPAPPALPALPALPAGTKSAAESAAVFQSPAPLESRLEDEEPDDWALFASGEDDEWQRHADDCVWWEHVWEYRCDCGADETDEAESGDPDASIEREYPGLIESLNAETVRNETRKQRRRRLAREAAARAKAEKER